MYRSKGMFNERVEITQTKVTTYKKAHVVKLDYCYKCNLAQVEKDSNLPATKVDFSKLFGF
jgi:hypothetical protein